VDKVIVWGEVYDWMYGFKDVPGDGLICGCHMDDKSEDWANIVFVDDWFYL
jgi:hypothetical protein